MTDGSNKHRRLVSFSLRTALLAVTVFGVWLGFHYSSVRRQHAAIATVKQFGGSVTYDYQLIAIEEGRRPSIEEAKSTVSPWLAKTFGRDHFHDVVAVTVAQWKNFELPKDPDATDVLLVRLARLPDLQSLSLGSLEVTDDNLRMISEMSNLRKLFIWRGAGVTDEGVGHLTQLSRLEKLDLVGTNATDDALRILGGLSALKELSVHDNQFTDQGLNYVGKMDQLEHLHIGTENEWASDAGLAHLGQLAQLEVLSLQGTEFTEDGLRHLLPLKNLKYLNLRYSDIDASVLAEALPECRIGVAHRKKGGWWSMDWNDPAKWWTQPRSAL